MPRPWTTGLFFCFSLRSGGAEFGNSCASHAMLTSLRGAELHAGEVRKQTELRKVNRESQRAKNWLAASRIKQLPSLKAQ